MNEKETLQLPNTDVEDDAIKRTQSLQSLNELESDLSKNKYCTDADVLKAVCVFSPESPVKNTIDERETTRKYWMFYQLKQAILPCKRQVLLMQLFRFQIY